MNNKILTDSQLVGKVFSTYSNELVEIVSFNSFKDGAPNDNVTVKYSTGQTQSIPRMYLTVSPKVVPIEQAMDNLLM